MPKLVEGGFGGRIAFRVREEWYVAYWAPLDTMEDALEIARVRSNVIMQDRLLQEAFMAFCKKVFETVALEALGTTPEWPRPATPSKD